MEKVGGMNVMSYIVSTEINGGKFESSGVEPRLLLVYFLRRVAGLKGARVGCDTGHCGACTVVMDGKTVKSCMILAVQANGSKILTVEGLAQNGKMHPLQEAFSENHALQCGYCTPGFLMASYELLQRHPNPTDDEISLGLCGNLCMCTGYIGIIKAVKAASQKIYASHPAETGEMRRSRV